MKSCKTILLLVSVLMFQLNVFSQIDTFFYVPPILKFTRDLPELNNVRFLFSTEFPSATVTIRSTDGSFTQSVIVQRGEVVTVTMPNNSTINAAYGSQGRNMPSVPRSDIGLTIRSTHPITAIQFQDRANNSDLITLKGTKGLGTDFYCGSQVNPTNNPTAASNDDLHFIGILATEDGTSVQVTGNPHPLNGFATPGTILLQKGQGIVLRSNTQNETIAGTRIQSNKPIAVTSGGNHIRNRAVAGTAADAGIDNLIPANSVGNTYFAVKGGATQTNEYLVIIPTSSTTIRVNGVSVGGTLAAGQVFVHTFPSADPIGRAYFIELSAPSFVYQVTGRNNSNELGMCLLPPSICTGAPYVAFNLIPQFTHEMTVMLPTASVQSFRLNGRSLQQLGITPTPMSALPSWSTWRIFQSQLDTTNLFIADQSMHVSLRATMNATGLFGYVSGYFQNLAIYDAATGLPVPDYFDLGTGCPGKTIAGCFRIESCDAIHRIDSAYAIKGSKIEWLNDTCYRLSPPSSDYIGVDTIVFYVSNNLGQKKVVSGIATWQGVVTKANAGDDRILSVRDTIHVIGNSLPNASVSWRQISGPSTLNFSQPNQPNSIISGCQVGDYYLEYSISTVCGTDKDTVYIGMISSNNQGAICTVQLPPDFIECNSSAVVVASNVDYRPIYSNQLSSNRYSWHISGGPYNYQGGTDSTNAFPKIKLEGGNIYRIVLTLTTQGLTCADTQWVYRAAPPIATIIDPPSVQLCNWPDTIWLQASTVGPVQQRTWTSSGTGFFIQPNQNETGYILSSLDKSLTSISFFFLAQGRTNGNCSFSASDTLTISIPTFNKAFAGLDRELCLQDTVQLQPQIPQVGNGTWRILQAPNTPIIENNILRNLVAGRYELEWRVENGVCGVSLDTVTITLVSPPSKAFAGVDRELCLQDTVQLQPQIPQVGAGTWRILQAPNTPVIESTVLKNLTSGVYQLEWRVENGVCAASMDTVTITLVAPPSKAFAGVDRELCLQDTVQLQPQIPQVGNGTWRILQSPNAAIIENNILRNVVAGRYELEWRVENGVCGASMDTVTITLVAPPSKAFAGIDRELCLQDTVQLQPQIPQVGIGSWRILQAPNTPTIENNILRNLVAGTYELEWRVENGICGASLDTVTITLVAPPSRAFAGIDRELCLQDTVQLQPQIPQVGIGSWRILQAPNTPTIENNILRNLVAGTYELEWRIENGICGASLDTVTITLVAPLSRAFAGIDRELCLQDTVKLQPQIPQVGNGTWRVLQAPNTPIIENNILRNLVAGRYELEWRVENGVCGASIDTVIFKLLEPIGNEIFLNDTIVCATASFRVQNKTLSGGNGIYSITWYVNNDGNGWNKIADSSISLSMQMIGERLALRREVVSGSCTSVSETNFIRPLIILENTLVGNQSICIGELAQKISGTLRTNSHHSSLNFFWQFRKSEQAEWQLIQGANDSFYIPTLSSQSTFYRRAVYINGCVDTVFSNPVFVEVFEALQSKILVTQTSICINQVVDSNSIKNQTAHQNLARFKWYVNGSLIGQSPTFPSMRVSVADSLLIVLETSDLRGCGNSRDSTTIIIKPLPSVGLQFEQLNNCSPAKVIFTPVAQHANQLIWNWGDGRNLDTTSIINFEKIFFTNSPRDFSVQLTALNDCGIDTASVSFTVQPNLSRVAVQLMGVDKKGCVPFTSYWKNNSIGVQSFVWDFGDGSKRIISGQQDTIFHKYAAAGKYEVKIFAQTSCGDTLVKEYLYVFEKPNLDFSFTPQTGCVGDTVFFNNKSDQQLQFQWRFPNGSIQSGYNTKYIFKEAGQFQVTLIGYQAYDDGIRCSDSIQYVVPVVSGLPGTINLSDTTVYCAPFTFTFQQFNTVAKQTVWDFGSGLKDTGTIVSHTYQQTGNYTSRMMAITDGGCVYEREIRIQVIAPEGELQASATTLCNTQELKLSVNGKHTSRYEWNDGLGNIVVSTNPSINFQYSQAGLYQPSVTLLNDAGCRVPLQINKPIQVQKIKADFLVEQKAVCDSVQLQFENKTNSNTALQYAWKFNAGVTSSVKTPASLVITQSGIQSIQMIAKDGLGCADTLVQDIPVKVYKMPKVQVNALKDICVGDVQEVKLSIQADTSLQSITWQLNGQNRSSDTIYKSVFQSPGSQTIQANISTAAGCTVEVERKFLVRPLPSIRVQGDTVVCKEQPVQIKAIGGEQYRWLNASAVSCIDCPTTLAFPSASGFVRVRGTDQWGCTANDSIYIHVAQPIQIQTKDIAFCEGGSGQIGVTGGQRYTWLPTQGLGNPTAAQTSVRVNRSSTFQVVGYDRWGCYTDTSRVQVVVQPKPRIVMKRDSIVAAGSQVVLRAQINSQSPVETIRWSPGASLSCTNCFEPIATVRNDQTYQVTVTNRDGCEQTDSIRIRTICTQAQLYIPNTFTPDGDGLNDRLIVRGTQITKVLSFTIFNRWGAVVFRQQNFAPNDPSFGWDGTINGKKADADVFVVLCEFLCENDRKVLYKGNVALIR